MHYINNILQAILFSISLSNCQTVSIQTSNESSRLQVHHIIGGERTALNEFAHMVAIGYGYPLMWYCGGSLISNQFVLTAAHCVKHREFGPARVVRLGVTNLHSDNSTDIGIENGFVHPNYHPPLRYNDIALLKLKNRVEFSSAIFPASLNTAPSITTRTSKLTAIGWGSLNYAGPMSDDLMKVVLNIYSNHECNKRYANDNRHLPIGIRDDSQICAGGGVGDHKDTCQGDSGGSLVTKTGRIYTIVGVTSFGKGCGIANTPGVYTRVSAFVPWIEGIVGI